MTDAVVIPFPAHRLKKSDHQHREEAYVREWCLLMGGETVDTSLPCDSEPQDAG